MTRRKEIVTATLGCRQSYVDLKRPITPDDAADAFEKDAYWDDKTMLERMLKYLEVEHPTFFEHFGEEIRNVMEG